MGFGYVIAGDIPKLAASALSMLEGFVDAAPEDMRDALGDEMHGFEKLCQTLGTSVVVNGDFTAAGLRGLAFFAGFGSSAARSSAELGRISCASSLAT